VRNVVLTAAGAVEGGGDAVRDELVDANRLRRMDRFGRSGVLAGARALSAAGLAAASPGAAPDPRFGVVVGTAFGCRDAMTQHQRLLASAARVEDLAPSVFAATVHNTVGGELAILYALGGAAETLVSGRTAGLEALALAASRVARGDADRILVVAAEGIDEEMRRAFARENPGATLIESAAAVLVEGIEEDEISLLKRGSPAFIDAALSFGASPRDAGSEEDLFFEGVGGGEARGGGGAVTERPGAPGVERLGASGLWEIASDVAAGAARSVVTTGDPSAHSPSKKIHRYSVLDVDGSCAAITLAFFS
jgi:3-oxoacyl-[acyl-carrier-protein] synthase II